MQSHTTIKENTETILQLAANMRISCLGPNLYPVRDATLETLCLRSYILFHMFRNQITYFLWYYPAITDLRTQNLPPRFFAKKIIPCSEILIGNTYELPHAAQLQIEK